jgi:hypothetical protein
VHSWSRPILASSGFVKAQLSPIPDPLCHNLDWSPIGSASAQSSIAAILTGFVFAGIVVILSVRAPLRREAAQALKLLFTAFFGLAVTAYLLADITGEQTCPRAETTEALMGGSLGTFSVVTIVSFTWLVIAYKGYDYDVLKFVHGLVYVSCAFVALLLTTSATSYLNADLYDRSDQMADAFLDGTGILTLIVGAAWIFWLHRRKRPLHIKRTVSDIAVTTDGAVERCVWAALSYLALTSLATGVEASLPPRMWYPPAPWAIYVATGGSIGLPLVVLAFSLGAIARTSKATIQSV